VSYQISHVADIFTASRTEDGTQGAGDANSRTEPVVEAAGTSSLKKIIYTLEKDLKINSSIFHRTVSQIKNNLFKLKAPFFKLTPNFTQHFLSL
jgi:hypothetical protein